MMINKTIEGLYLRLLSQIAAPWKFDVFKSSIFALQGFASRANMYFWNVKFPRGNYQPVVPPQKHSIRRVDSVYVLTLNRPLLAVTSRCHRFSVYISIG